MPSQKIWSRGYLHLLAMEMVMQFGLYLTRPVASSYAVELGASVTAAGFIAGLLAVAAVAVRPVSGLFCDLFSKKDLLVVSSGLFAASAFGCALTDSVFVVAVCCALQGFAFAFKSTLVISLVSMVVPKPLLGSGVGWLSIGYTIACAFGPACGAYLGVNFGYPTIYGISGLIFLAGMALAILFEAPVASCGSRSRQARSGLSSVAKSPILCGIGKMFHMPTLRYSLIAGLMMVAPGTNSALLVLMENRGEIQGAPLYFLVYSVVALGAKPFAGRMSDRRGASAVVPPSLVVAMVGILVPALFPTAAAVVVAAACMAAGQASAYAAMQAESMRGIEESKLGRAANTFYIGPDIGMGLGPVLGGLVLQAFGASATFVFDAFSIALALLLFVAYRKNGTPRHDCLDH